MVHRSILTRKPRNVESNVCTLPSLRALRLGCGREKSARQHDELQHCSAHHRRPPAFSHKADTIKEILATMNSDSPRIVSPSCCRRSCSAQPRSHAATQPSHPHTQHDRARDGHDVPCPCALLLVCSACRPEGDLDSILVLSHRASCARRPVACLQTMLKTSRLDLGPLCWAWDPLVRRS